LLFPEATSALPNPADADIGEVNDPLAGMIWHIATATGHFSVRAEQPARVSVLTPRPGFLFVQEPGNKEGGLFGRPGKT